MSTSAARSRAALKQYTWRRRQRPHCHTVVAPVLVTDPTVAMLIESGWLSDGEWPDRQQLGAAITALLQEMTNDFRYR